MPKANFILKQTQQNVLLFNKFKHGTLQLFLDGGRGQARTVKYSYFKILINGDES